MTSIIGVLQGSRMGRDDRPRGEEEGDLVAPAEREYVGVPVLVLLLDTEPVLVLDTPEVLVPVTVLVDVLVEVTEPVARGEAVPLLEAEGDLYDSNYKADEEELFSACLHLGRLREEHDLVLCEVVYKSIKEGPPKTLAKAPMAANDMNAVRSKQETVQVEVEELVPMTAKDLRETGLQRVLDAEVAKEREEAAADAAAEFLLLHGITKEEKETRDRDAANRF
jgi:hypothetical protein